MAKSPSLSLLCHSLIFLFSFTVIHGSHSATNKVTELVDSICNQTLTYKFCVDSLYSDPRTPDADPYTLAYISFRLAYTSASNTQNYIAELLKNAISSSHDQDDCLGHLQRCSHDYDKAASALKVAYNDLDSETFYELADLAGGAAHAADDCQAAFEGRTSPIASRNHDLKGLCEICSVIAKLFTGSL